MTITHDEFNAATQMWIDTMGFDFEDKDNRKRDAHVVFLRAQDAYYGVTLADAMIKLLYPELTAPAPLPEGRYRGVIHTSGTLTYIWCESLLRELRTLSVMGVKLSQIPDGAEVEFSPDMFFSCAIRVVVVGNEASEAAYAKRALTPPNPIQRQPRNLQEAREQAAERKTAGRVPRISVPPLLSGDKAVRDAAYADYMSRFYEDVQEDSAYQQQIDVRSDL